MAEATGVKAAHDRWLVRLFTLRFSDTCSSLMILWHFCSSHFFSEKWKHSGKVNQLDHLPLQADMFEITACVFCMCYFLRFLVLLLPNAIIHVLLRSVIFEFPFVDFVLRRVVRVDKRFLICFPNGLLRTQHWLPFSPSQNCTYAYIVDGQEGTNFPLRPVLSFYAQWMLITEVAMRWSSGVFLHLTGR